MSFNDGRPFSFGFSIWPELPPELPQRLHDGFPSLERAPAHPGNPPGRLCWDWSQTLMKNAQYYGWNYIYWRTVRCLSWLLITNTDIGLILLNPNDKGPVAVVQYVRFLHFPTLNYNWETWVVWAPLKPKFHSSCILTLSIRSGNGSTWDEDKVKWKWKEKNVQAWWYFTCQNLRKKLLVESSV